ncbi:MAG: DNA polymerase III subunit delta [Gemmataceae bacterium]
MDALAFLAKPPAKIGPLYVLHGDEPFLKRHALRTLRAQLLGPDADEQSASVYQGDKIEFALVFDELSTVAFFQPRRLVVIENADPFVTAHRGILEKRVGSMPATGCLVLDVKTWAANTRLAKLVDSAATIVCKAPAAYRMAQWCSDWAAAQHKKQLAPQAAALLVDLIGPEMGLLDQEILKLAIYVGERNRIEAEDVDKLVGQSRAENTWKIFDLIAAGQAGDALVLLDRLLDQEESRGIVGFFSMQLRRLAAAHRSCKGRLDWRCPGAGRHPSLRTQEPPNSRCANSAAGCSSCTTGY